MLFRGLRRIHFVGIGGIGMSGIAEVLLSLDQNFRVSGSDLKRSQITERLASMGAIISEGHKSENVVGADVIVTSSAVRDDNPEVVAARQKQIPVIPRAEMLAELMRNRGVVLSRDLILTKVWGYDAFVDKRTVDVHIRWLREKIENDSSDPQRIVTVRGVGYRFEG